MSSASSFLNRLENPRTTTVPTVVSDLDKTNERALTVAGNKAQEHVHTFMNQYLQ